VQHKRWDEHGRERKEVKRKITDRIKNEKLNEIEMCVCVLDGELWIESDEWVIRWVDGSIAWSCQYIDDLLGSLPESPHARRRAFNAMSRRFSFTTSTITLFFGRTSS